PRENRQYGLELAQRGYVVLCPDYPSFGDYPYDFGADEYVSGTMKGIFNHIRCIDYLISRDEVDAERIGVIGHSLGGHNAMYVAAFDERVKVIVSSCGWTPFHDYYAGNITGWTSDRYMPLLKTKYELNPDRVPFDFYEVVAALAPRPFYSSSPLKDANFDYRGVQKAEKEARKVYELLGAADQLVVRYPDCEHDFPVENRNEAYAILDRHLNFSPVSGRNFAAELPRIPPQSPEDALKTFEVLHGFRMDQTAAEPLVNDPVAMSFDEDGRLFVVEMRGYSEQYEEVLGQIRVLKDQDGDGHFDVSHVLAEGLSWPTAILTYKGGVFVGAAPHIYYLKDTTGDGKADVRKIVFTGFGKSNVQGLLNSFHWGLDNRIHGATSSAGGKITRPDVPDWPAVELSRRDFSFDPEKLDLRPESGGAQHGMDFDEWGHKFVCSNSDHIQAVMIADQYLQRNPYLSVPQSRISIAADGPQAEVFRTSDVEPWRLVRTRLRVAGLVKGPVEGGGRAAGYFTGSTGVTIYKGNAWPKEYAGLAIIGDVGSNIIHRKKVEWNGLVPVASRMDAEKEFVTSRDIWFRPVQFANAPDGTLHVLDMYREVIEHPASLPPEIKQHLDLTSGRDRGRLYRILPENFQQPPILKMSQMATVELVGLLEHPNAWHRTTAARLLFERQDSASVNSLKKLAQHSASPLVRMHALYALSGLHALDAETLLVGFKDEHLQVRRHAIQLSEGELLTDERVRTQLFQMADDPDVEVRYQLTFTLGEIHSPEIAPLLAKIVAKDLGNTWIETAVMSSLSSCAGQVFAELTESSLLLQSDKGIPFLKALAFLIGRSGESGQLEEAFAALQQLNSDQFQVKGQLLISLSEGIGRSSTSLEKVLAANPQLKQMMDALLVQARQEAVDMSRSDESRVNAVSVLGVSQYEPERKVLLSLLNSQQPVVVQQSVIEVMGKYLSQQISQDLLKRCLEFSPAVRSDAISLLLTKPSWTRELLNASVKGDFPPALISVSQLQLLKNSRDQQVQSLAEELLKASQLSPRNEVVQQYQTSLSLNGEVESGRQLFQKNCAVCHRLENQGREVGPNLMAMKNRGSEVILLNVLDPNRELNPEFSQYVITTIQGRVFSGLIVGESA
ncbi:MAG: alpha/beta fold hydrolase, partial [Planctomycetaceae bacterium]|nr:alpha/beta fold hydrolase [Planctomycetaceae bacterium]